MGIDWQKIWREKGTESLLLLPFALVYASGWIIYELMYRFGLKKPVKPHSPIICIGNLIVGGAGKTPVTIHIAKVLAELGRQVVISVNGYGAPRSHNAHSAPAGELDAREWGDEAALIRSKLPDVPLIVGRDRVIAAQICRDLHPDAVLLLDDGFQHLPLEKDVTILLDPADLENRWPMPSGPYREPRATGKLRADTVIPGEFKIGMTTVQIKNLDGTTPAIETGINALCALARPERFVDTLEAHGYRVSEMKLLQDHDPMKSKNLFEGLDPTMPVVVTEKDWVKLKHRSDLGYWNIMVATYDVEIEPAPLFREWLKNRLDEIKA